MRRLSFNIALILLLILFCISAAQAQHMEYESKMQTIALIAYENGAYSGTFSSDKPTFFPKSNTVEVLAVYAKDDKIKKERIANYKGGAYIPANTGVLIRSTRKVVLYFIDKQRNIKIERNMLRPSSEPMTGDFKFYKWAYNNYSKHEGLDFYWGADDGGPFEAKPGGAYLSIPKQ